MHENTLFQELDWVTKPANWKSSSYVFLRNPCNFVRKLKSSFSVKAFSLALTGVVVYVFVELGTHWGEG